MNTFDPACAEHGGVRSTRLRHGYEFAAYDAAKAAADALGLTTPPTHFSHDRTAVLYLKGRVIYLRVERRKDEPTIHDWVNATRHYEARLGELAPPDLSDQIRSVCVRLSSGILADDQYRVWIPEHQHWSRMPASTVIRILLSMGYDRRDAERTAGQLSASPWEIVSRPFSPEYPEPGRRIWNLGAPQLRHPQPRPGKHPHWDMILEHVGAEITGAIGRNEWAQDHGIRTGADWLRLHHAFILRRPELRTPYLFLFGPENSGKSILHESFELLVTRGVVKADRALTSDFNGELAGAILCVVEEKDISKTPAAHARVKDAVTALRLSIRKMRTDTYMIDNYTHWIQCANDPSACFVRHGDTRIQCISVSPLSPDTRISKELLMQRLAEEAEAFTHTLLHLPLPEPSGRLALEIIDTPSRARLADDAVPDFIVALADLARQGRRTLSARELAVALHQDCGYVGAPTDSRQVSRLLDEHRSYLDARGVECEIGSRTAKGRLITIGPV